MPDDDQADFTDDRPHQDTLNVDEESLRTQDRNGLPLTGSAEFVDDRGSSIATEQQTLVKDGSADRDRDAVDDEQTQLDDER